MKSLSSAKNESLANVYDDGYLRVEHEGFVVTCNQQYVKLSRTQFLIFSRLVRTPQKFVAFEELWRQTWGQEKPYNPRSLCACLYHVRRKLEPFEIVIETSNNLGYRFVPHQ